MMSLAMLILLFGISCAKTSATDLNGRCFNNLSSSSPRYACSMAFIYCTPRNCFENAYNVRYIRHHEIKVTLHGGH